MGRSCFFDRAEQKASEPDKTGIDGKHVHKILKPETKIRYKDANALWLEYVSPVSFRFMPQTSAISDFKRTVIVPNVAKTPSRVLRTWKHLCIL